MSDEARDREQAAALPLRPLALRAGVPDPADAIASYRAVGRDSRSPQPLEVEALRHQVRLLHEESSRLRAQRDALALADAQRLPRRVAGRLRQMRRGH